MTDEKYENLKTEFFKANKEYESYKEKVFRAQKDLEKYQDEMANVLLEEIKQLADKMKFYGYYLIADVRSMDDYTCTFFKNTISKRKIS